jgi:hypothetical protein
LEPRGEIKFKRPIFKLPRLQHLGVGDQFNHATSNDASKSIRRQAVALTEFRRSTGNRGEFRPIGYRDIGTLGDMIPSNGGFTSCSTDLEIMHSKIAGGQMKTMVVFFSCAFLGFFNCVAIGSDAPPSTRPSKDVYLRLALETEGKLQQEILDRFFPMTADDQ